MGSEELVSVGVDDKGRERFTTREMVQVEKNLQQSTRELLGREDHGVSERFLDQAEAQRTLSDEQKNAFRHITENTPDIAVVEGYAGSGKSYMLGAAREAWEAQGYRVLGAALAGKAAEGLEVSSGIQSRSLHAWEYVWKKGTERLTGKDVLVVDEAGMVGARQMNQGLGAGEGRRGQVGSGGGHRAAPGHRGGRSHAFDRRGGRVGDPL